MQWYTAGTAAERQEILKELLASDPGDHKLHESFDPNNARAYTRRDFGWPNALFSEFVLTTYSGMPPLPVPSPPVDPPTPAPQPSGHQTDTPPS
jgi:meiotically up-regulated gene 157 (Mug157) protein